MKTNNKQHHEEIGEVWTKELGGKTVRLWNVYGWEEPDIRSHVIPDLVIQGSLKAKSFLIQNKKC